MEIGPIGARVADRVAHFRDARRLSYAELSRMLTDMGRDIAPLGLRRLEAGQRKVDADDLVALALALGVSPLVLMLPTEDGRLVPDGEVYNRSDIWDWAHGRRALIGDQLDFVRASNPLEWPQMEKLIQRLGVTGDLAAGVLHSRSGIGQYEPAPDISEAEARASWESVQKRGSD